MNKKVKKKNRLRIESGSILSDLLPLESSFVSETQSLNFNPCQAPQPLGYFFPVYPGDISMGQMMPNQFMMPFALNQQQASFPAQRQDSQSSKFDLSTFKTTECKIKTYHDHKQCMAFHSDKDRRRSTAAFTYVFDLCPKQSQGTCDLGNNCQFSHNTVEHFYHPKKYKTKFCTSMNPNQKAEKCKYGVYCSFCHSEEELQIKLLHKQKKTLEFWSYEYKTVYCPFNHPHDKSSCEYSHNVQDYRRDVREKHYKPEICKKWNVSSDVSTYLQGGCEKMENCDKCHGWKELEYHPEFYKTKPCANGDVCTRNDCGYYHSSEDRRFADQLEDESQIFVNPIKVQQNKKAKGGVTKTCASLKDASNTIGINSSNLGQHEDMTIDSSFISNQNFNQKPSVNTYKRANFEEVTSSTHNVREGLENIQFQDEYQRGQRTEYCAVR